MTRKYFIRQFLCKFADMNKEFTLLQTIRQYKELGIDRQIDYDKFYLYSLITHSTAIEGSTLTELENQLLFDEGITAKGRSITEQLMNLDLKNAYETIIKLSREKADISIEMLKKLSALVMKNTGNEYHTPLGSFFASEGDLRLLNVTAGAGGSSYMDYKKVPAKLSGLCDELNNQRHTLKPENVYEVYRLSFMAHYQLVTIHPWADGNGRMARLLMNYIQVEFGAIPSKINKEQKTAYIQALIETRETDNVELFVEFMLDEHIRNLKHEIDLYQKTISNATKSREKIIKSREKTAKSREKILTLVADNPKITIQHLSQQIGITTKAVEKNIAKLKAQNKLFRIGPDKGGHWEVRE